MEQKIVDHLFRHQYGKMVAILTNFFGLSHLEMIEDAVQDTFVKATLQWRTKQPENPEAWLMTAAKNRIIDLLRQIKAEKVRLDKVTTGSSVFQLNELFLDHEVEDSQLRMFFVACHPALSAEEQIAFSLKTISGFSMKEIAAALLLKDETIKKRLVRARKTIIAQQIHLDYPDPQEAQIRLADVMQVIYLIFNEGFHSTKPDQLINKDLCGEALRLCKLLLKKESFRSGSLYALFALMCFHSSRIESKINSKNEIVDLENQDRSKWYMPLIILGNNALNKALNYEEWSAYHYESAIAGEHIKAVHYENTNWNNILKSYQKLYELQPSDLTLLSMATVHIQLDQLKEARKRLDSISAGGLQQRMYLLHGCYAEYYHKIGNQKRTIEEMDNAIKLCSNELEKKYLYEKKNKLLTKPKPH
ncbi:MAG: sigma-70 family RNA polymerase sigma factor [Flavobacteriales bacterium]|nr:sigma-70 family RNA polymerase sigma factor [Flavobacteriales bacterium]